MQSYIRPVVYNIPDPIGIDFAIAQMQAYLNVIPWLQVCYGRTYPQKGNDIKDGKPVSTWFPETWGKNYEPVNVMPNDNVKSQIFFVVRDPGEAAGVVSPFDNQLILSQPVSLVFWGNLQKINPAKKYFFGEEIKRDLLHYLMQYPSFKTSRTYEGFTKVLESFTISDKYEVYIKPPYYGIRIDGIISYPVFSENICSGIPGVYLPSNIDEIMMSITEAYTVKRVDLEVGIDIEANIAGEDIIPVHLIAGPKYFDLALNDVLMVIANNQPNQVTPVNIVDKTMDFTSQGGIYSGVVSILYRKKFL